ncbi:MAG: aminotransferase class V-fold PLP-dependent enzyme [Odoribacteraceae bacterium]|jgi:aspartate aminotransferase-like enzyme|nr:aminotransferase class V-fold PLP-dependent enzyme [Odoribacteraceae bacterium]
MERYRIPLVPGPVSVPDEVLGMAIVNYGSGMIEPEYFAMYKECERLLQQLMQTRSRVVIQTGEGMLALWTALKSTLNPGDKVLAISTGMFGEGLAAMARAIGCETRVVAHEFNETVHDFDRVEREIVDFRPRMITMVQCETPSGTLNPVREIGELKRRHGVPLLCADMISGIGGVEVEVDAWGVDLALGASQKCLSSPASLAFLSVSEAAWERVHEVGYVGYEALLPFAAALESGEFPYTPYWQGLAQLKRACELIMEEGMDVCFARHREVAGYCRERLSGMGIALYPEAGRATCSPTVTAARVPEALGWEKLDAALRARGAVFGNNFGALAGKVFRVGHMGSQANIEMVAAAMDILECIVRR